MVTQNGEAGGHACDGDDAATQSLNSCHTVDACPLDDATESTPSSGDVSDAPRSPRYQPYRPQFYQPRKLEPLPANDVSDFKTASNTPYVSPPLRQHTYPISSFQDHEHALSWYSSNGVNEQSKAPCTNSIGPALKPSVSASNLRAKAGSPFCREQFQPSTGSLALPVPRFPQQYQPSELPSDDQVRSSLHSALTSNSSIWLTSGTERSSVLTKASSMIDFSQDSSDVDGGMSVDDAISMYLDGFEDDPPQPTAETTNRDLHDEDGTRSKELLEAMSSDMADPKEIKDVATRNLTIPNVVLPGTVPPPLSDETDTRDRYGFHKATHHITLAEYDSWSSSYSTYLQNRGRKWAELLRQSKLPYLDPIAFPPRSAKVKRYIRKGIPPEYRGPAWFWYAGGYSHLNRNRGLYHRLVQRALEEPTNDDKEHIERDLHRTFPDNVHFKPDLASDIGGNLSSGSGSSNPKYCGDATETQIIQSLRRVLYAFSAHNPKIGYTQSLNFIAGLLLLFLPEEKAFWMLHIITSYYLPGTHDISLEGANIDLWILMVLLKESAPAIYARVARTTLTTSRSKSPVITTKSQLPDITLGLANWLMSMFIGSLPLETTLRVWDIFFYDGSRTFFRVALALIRFNEKEILGLSDPLEIFQVVQTTPKKLIDANALTGYCFARRFRSTQARIESLRAARRKAIREEKGRTGFPEHRGRLPANVDGRPSTSAAYLPRTSSKNPKHPQERRLP